MSEKRMVTVYWCGDGKRTELQRKSVAAARRVYPACKNVMCSFDAFVVGASRAGGAVLTQLIERNLVVKRGDDAGDDGT